MDRVMVYPGQITLETDLLSTNRNTLIALAALAQDLFGTSTAVSGCAVAPNSPAALNVVVAPGRIYALENLDSTNYSSLPADTTHQIIKQGIALNSTTLATLAPTTSGQSINYLIEAGYQDTDTNSIILPYYNSANPTQPYSGPNNSGTAQNTLRQGQLVLQAKAGTAATTGTQTTPAPDSGFVGIAVVTVAYGQATVTSGNITAYASAPLLSQGGATGVTTLAGGIIMQRGVWTASATAGNPVAVTFPRPFPNACWQVTPSAQSASTTPPDCWYDTPTVNGFNGRSSLVSAACSYIAIGN